MIKNEQVFESIASKKSAVLFLSVTCGIAYL